MNRYMVAGALMDMRLGKQVLYVGRTRVEARELLGEVRAQLWPGERVMTTHGMEQVRAVTGGRIRITSAGSSLRGVSATVVIVDATLTKAQAEEIAIVVGRGGELIHA